MELETVIIVELVSMHKRDRMIRHPNDYVKKREKQGLISLISLLFPVFVQKLKPVLCVGDSWC